MRELELKFAIEPGFELPATLLDQPDTSLRSLPPLDLHAAYYDTPDLRLARNGITLRYRTGEGEGGKWTLKLPSVGDAHEREEIDAEGDADTPPQEISDLVVAYTRSEELQPLVTLQTTRRRWAVDQANGGGDLAELVHDEVAVYREQELVDHFRELELESKGAPPDRLDEIARDLVEGGAVPSAPTPKALRAIGSLLEPEIDPVERIDRREPAGVAVRHAIVHALDRMRRNDPLARLGSGEGVHQMRVAARRLRSDLKTFGPLVPSEWADPLRAELKWLGNLLGAIRDLDVMEAKLLSAAEDLESSLSPLFDELARRKEEARAVALEELRGPRYVALVDALVAAAQSPPLEPAAARPCGEVLPPLVARRWKALRRNARALDVESEPERWHETRIAAKRARYAAEAIAPAIGRKAGRCAVKFADLCSKVQDALGDLQDAHVAIDTIERVADENSGEGELNRAAGRLLERQRLEIATARENFWSSWRKLDRKKNVKWLKRQTAH